MRKNKETKNFVQSSPTVCAKIDFQNNLQQVFSITLALELSFY